MVNSTRSGRVSAEKGNENKTSTNSLPTNSRNLKARIASSSKVSDPIAASAKRDTTLPNGGSPVKKRKFEERFSSSSSSKRYFENSSPLRRSERIEKHHCSKSPLKFRNNNKEAKESFKEASRGPSPQTQEQEETVKCDKHKTVRSHKKKLLPARAYVALTDPVPRKVKYFDTSKERDKLNDVAQDPMGTLGRNCSNDENRNESLGQGALDEDATSPYVTTGSTLAELSDIHQNKSGDNDLQAREIFMQEANKSDASKISCSEEDDAQRSLIGVRLEQCSTNRESGTVADSTDFPVSITRVGNDELYPVLEGNTDKKSSLQIEASNISDVPDGVDSHSTTVELNNAKGYSEEGVWCDESNIHRIVGNPKLKMASLSQERRAILAQNAPHIIVGQIWRITFVSAANVKEWTCGCCDGKNCKNNYQLPCANSPLEMVPSGMKNCPFHVDKKHSCIHSACSVDLVLDSQGVEVKGDNRANGNSALSVPVSSEPAAHPVFLNKPYGKHAIDSKPDSLDPKFLEFWVPIQLSHVQLELYCSSLIAGSTILRSCSRDLIEACTDILVSTRKCCDHPYLVDSSLPSSLTNGHPQTEYLDIGVHASSKLDLLDKVLQGMKNQGLRAVIIFHQFTGGSVKIGDILDDFLRQRFGVDSYERVESGLVMAKKQVSIQMFNNRENGRFVFLLENRACLSSIKLSMVDAVIIYGSDWNPLNDLKALRKIKFDSHCKLIKVFRLYSLHTLEENILSLAKEDVILESNQQSISRRCHSLLSTGANLLFDELDRFHENVSNPGCLKTCNEKLLLDDIACEMLTQISDNEGKTDPQSTVILKAQKSETTYSVSDFLFGREAKMTGEEPAQVFWLKLLDERYPQWKYIAGVSERVRRKTQKIDEEPQILKDDARKKRKISTDTSGPVSLEHIDRKKGEISAVHSPAKENYLNHNENLLQQEESELSKAACGGGSVRSSQRNLHKLLKPDLTQLCDILQLPENVKIVAELFLEYVINNLHVSQEPVTLLQAFKLSLCWRAATFLKYKLDHRKSLELVIKELKFECNESEAESIYSKLHMLKKKFPLPINALLKCMEPNHLADLPIGRPQDNNEKHFSAVTSDLTSSGWQEVKAGGRRAIDILPEDYVGLDCAVKLELSPVRFDKDIRPCEDEITQKMQTVENSSILMGHINQKQVPSIQDFESCLQQGQQRQSSADSASSLPHQVPSIIGSRPGSIDATKWEAEPRLSHESSLQQGECSPLTVVSSQSLNKMFDFEVESSFSGGPGPQKSLGSPTQYEGIMTSYATLGEHIHGSRKTAEIFEFMDPGRSENGCSLLAGACGEMPCPQTGAESTPYPSSNMESSEAKKAIQSDGAHTELLNGSSIPIQTFQSSDCLPFVESGGLIKSNGISGRFSCSSQIREISTFQTGALPVSHDERTGISDVQVMENSEMREASQTDLRPMVDNDCPVVSGVKEDVERNSSHPTVLPSMSVNSVGIQVLQERSSPETVLPRAANGQLTALPTFEQEQTFSTESLIWKQNVEGSIENISSNQPQENQEDRSDSQVPITDGLGASHVHREPVSDRPDSHVPIESQEDRPDSQVPITDGMRTSHIHREPVSDIPDSEVPITDGLRTSHVLREPVSRCETLIQNQNQFADILSNRPLDVQENRTDLESARIYDLRSTDIQQERTGFFQPITTQLPSQGLYPDPLKNEMWRISKEIELVGLMLDNTKLHLKSEYEHELENLTRKYNLLVQNAEKACLERQRTLRMIYNKVLCNQILAKEFRSKFSDNKAGAANSGNPRGSPSSSGLPANVPASSSSMVSLNDHNPHSFGLSSQARDIISPSTSTSASVPPVRVFHHIDLLTSNYGRPRIPSASLTRSSFGNNHPSSVHRSAAPHLHSFRPSSSMSPPLPLPTSGVRVSQSQPPATRVFRTMPVLLQPRTGSGSASFPSCDASSNTNQLSENHDIPADHHVVLQAAASRQPLPSNNTWSRTSQLSGNHTAPTVMLSTSVRQLSSQDGSSERFLTEQMNLD